MDQKVPVIVSIGKSAQDIFLQSTKAFEPFEHKGVFYEQLPLGQKLDLDEVTFSTGGNVANAAVTFARQGLHSVYSWCIGDGITSDTILQVLDKEGIDTRFVSRSPEYKASTSVILLASNGERTILNYKGKMPTFEHNDLNFNVLDGADWVYLSSLGDIRLLEQIIGEAAKRSVKVMLNPAGSELAEADRLRSLLEDVEILITNKEEAQQIVEGKNLDELVRHGLSYCPVVIVSDGPNGATASDGKTIIHAGMYEDVPVVDRTGGGDAFGSGFLSQWSQGKSLAEALIFASANSTSVVTKIGAKEGILHQGVELHDMQLQEETI